MRTYEVTVEVGDLWDRKKYLVAAATSTSAINQAIKRAHREEGVDPYRHKWRCVFLNELRTEILR